MKRILWFFMLFHLSFLNQIFHSFNIFQNVFSITGSRQSWTKSFSFPHRSVRPKQNETGRSFQAKLHEHGHRVGRGRPGNHLWWRHYTWPSRYHACSRDSAAACFNQEASRLLSSKHGKIATFGAEYTL